MTDKNQLQQNQPQISIDKLNAGIEQLSSTVENGKNVATTEHIREHKKSRVVLTGLFAALGAKAGASAGATLGGAYHVLKNDGNKLPEAHINTESPFSSIKMGFREGLEGDGISKKEFRMGMGILTGGIIGTLALGIIGWARGTRLEKPSDLLEHPLQSLGKIFSNDDNKNHLYKKGNDTYWQNKIIQVPTKDKNINIVVSK
jgi:hypothetical protein